jgi:hypothetical protein
MKGKLILVLLAVVSPFLVLTGTADDASMFDNSRSRGGYVVPCSLDGVNPIFHPDIFGSAAAARQFGFVQSRDGVWHVEPNCHIR